MTATSWCREERRASSGFRDPVRTERAGASHDPTHRQAEDVTADVRRGSSWRIMALTFVLVLGLLVLPQFTIAGHHWRFWAL